MRSGAIAEALEVAKVRADVFTSTLTQRALWRFMNSPGICTSPAQLARALPRTPRCVRRRAHDVCPVGASAPAGCGRQRVARASVAHLHAGGLRCMRARRRTGDAGRAVLSNAQWPARAAPFVRTHRYATAREGARRIGEGLRDPVELGELDRIVGEQAERSR